MGKRRSPSAVTRNYSIPRNTRRAENRLLGAADTGCSLARNQVVEEPSMLTVVRSDDSND
jgi:hypothetical protein